MGVSNEVIEAARAAGESGGVAAAVLLAVAIVETNAQAFAPVEGRTEPLIRFEGHYFDRLLPPDTRAAARAAGISHPEAGRVRNPAGQAGRWALLHRAAGIHEAAAYASVSWGLCQVMGAHWKALGYPGPAALAEQARHSAVGQFEIGARFLRLGRLDQLLENGDHAGFARRYNGPAFRRNSYDAKIAAAHRRARALLGAAVPVLRREARGAAVLALQEALARAGHPLAADGVFGPRTEQAVRAFQYASNLAVDGIAGPRTMARLGITAPVSR